MKGHGGVSSVIGNARIVSRLKSDGLLGGMKWLARARGLRGSWLDPFRFGPEKAVDRSLLANYEADLDLIAKTCGNPEEALRLAAWPAAVRGFGPVREAALKNAAVTREGARAALMA